MDVVEFLVVNGARVNAEQNDGWTPLSRAARNGHTHVVKYLVSRGARVLHVDNEGRSSILHAAQNGHADVVKALLEYGADADQADKDGITPLIAAAAGGHLLAAIALIAHGVDLNHEDHRGRTAAFAAAYAGHPDVLDHLQRQGCRVACSRNGEIDAPMVVLRTCEKIPEVQSAACEGLCLAVDQTPSVMTRVLEEGGLGLVFRAMHMHRWQPLVQVSALDCLRAFIDASDDEMVQRMEKEGVLTAATQSLRTHPTEASVQRAAVSVFCSLCRRPDSAEAVLNRHILKLVITSMVRHKSSGPFQLAAIRLMLRLATDETRRDKMILLGAIPVIIAALRAHPVDGELQEAGCSVRCLPSHRLCLAPRATACQSMDSSQCCLFTCPRSLAVLDHRRRRRPSTNDCPGRWRHGGGGGSENTPKVCAARSCRIAGALPPKHFPLLKGTVLTPIRSSLCQVMRNLACHESNNLLMVRDGSISSIVQAIAAHPHSTDVQIAGLEALGLLVENDPDIRERVANEGGVTACIEPLRTHTDVAVLATACKTLMDIVPGLESVRVNPALCCRIIVEAMVRAAASSQVQTAACRALTALAHFGKCQSSSAPYVALRRRP